MNDKLNPTLVGAFVLLLGAALMGAVLWLSVGLGGRKHYAHYQSMSEESVAGLNVDAPVKYLGVEVGKVSALAIDPHNSRQVRMRFLIAVGTPIKQDTEAVLKSQGLTGVTYVELNGGSPGAAALLPTPAEPEPSIRSRPSLSARLENVLGTVLANIDKVSANLNAVFDADNRAALKQTLAGQQETLRTGIRQAALTAQRTADASTGLAPALARVAAAASAVEVAAGQTGAASERAGLAVDSAASGVQQLRTDTLPELTRLLVELNQLAPALRRLADQTQRQPSSLLLGPATALPGPGESTPP